MRHLCFIGLMGSGKSTVAQLCSQKLQMQCVDSDKLVVEKAGMNIGEIIQTSGEKHFRSLEAEALKEILSNPEKTVVATGGGVVLSAALRKLIKKTSIAIWLKVSPEELHQRITFHKENEAAGSAGSTGSVKQENRPVIQQAMEQDEGDGTQILAALKKMEAERESLYRETADFILDGDTIAQAKLADMAVSYFAYRTGEESEK